MVQTGKLIQVCHLQLFASRRESPIYCILCVSDEGALSLAVVLQSTVLWSSGVYIGK